ncbi:MAG: threonylcarbamoyladenosine tRNA methylthiotransferase MtaB, partial [Nonlabens sp.]
NLPLVRGIFSSDTLENTKENARQISGQGIKEILLTRVNIGDYGKGEFGNKRNEHAFIDLAHALNAFKGIEHLRIFSSNLIY